MVEVKADALEESFDAILQGERIAGLEARINEIDAAVKARALAAARPPLDGVKGADVDPQRVAFVDRYLRKGLEAGVELKSFSGASGAAGGYAVPREIDAMVDSALNFRGEPYLPGNDLLTRYPGA
jgi:HK97 family phage major capsid protein